MQKLHGQSVYVYFLLFENVPRNKIGTFLNVLSEQNSTEHFFGGERSVLTEHLNLMFPRTLPRSGALTTQDYAILIFVEEVHATFCNS